MALVIIYAVLSHFDFVAKFTVKNLNKDFTNTGRGGGHHFMKVFHKTVLFFKRWLPLVHPSFKGTLTGHEKTRLGKYDFRPRLAETKRKN